MTPQECSNACFDICNRVPVIPVLEIHKRDHAEPLAEALSSGGLIVLEVTLRTPAALDVIKAMSQMPDVVVGAGTLLTADQVRTAKDAGAEFGVSPGASDSVLQTALEVDLPMLPGAVTATEIMGLLEVGYSMLKFFPAEAAGGENVLRSFSSPFPTAKFCPTGGIGKDNARQYLNLPNVVCVGGSWVASPDLMAVGEWGKIAMLAAETASI